MNPQETSLLATMAVRIIYSVIILAAGIWAGKILAHFVQSALERRKADPALAGFLGNLINVSLIAFAVIAALSQLGIETMSIVAILGAATLAVGLALKDSLGNFAAGVMILIFRQFKTGDIIEAAGVIGEVESLDLFSTQLRTADNKTVFVPNGKLVNDNIINYSMKGTRRLDLEINVSYDADLSKVRELLQEVLGEHQRILKEPEPTIGVLALAESNVRLAVRPWVENNDYWTVFFDLQEMIKCRFDEAGVKIPFPQREVHLHQEKPARPVKVVG
ncbi:MAG: mechanosensitive ion channel [Desulfuromonadales bacterium]|nr:mechanosensitive ion channel [Desulfuromonadales bacterium]